MDAVLLGDPRRELLPIHANGVRTAHPIAHDEFLAREVADDDDSPDSVEVEPVDERKAWQRPIDFLLNADLVAGTRGEREAGFVVGMATRWDIGPAFARARTALDDPNG